jgi:hypothetical protein
LTRHPKVMMEYFMGQWTWSAKSPCRGFTPEDTEDTEKILQPNCSVTSVTSVVENPLLLFNLARRLLHALRELLLVIVEPT